MLPPLAALHRLGPSLVVADPGLGRSTWLHRGLGSRPAADRYPKMIDEETFLGNKVFVGTSFRWFCPVPPFCRKSFFSTVVATFR